MAVRNRILYVLQYLWRNTDEDHPVITAELLSALKQDGFSTLKANSCRSLVCVPVYVCTGIFVCPKTFGKGLVRL